MARKSAPFVTARRVVPKAKRSATGTKINTTGAVSSAEGGTGATASASLAVNGVVPATQPVPTLQQWALWLLGLLLSAVAAHIFRRKAAG